MTLSQALVSLGFTPPPTELYDRIAVCKAWYRGKVDTFHRYPLYSGGRSLLRERATLSMAKHGCEQWANLLWNATCAVNLEDLSDDIAVNDCLLANDFTRRTRALIERAWALGIGAFVVYEKDGQPVIDTVPADAIYPLAYQGERVTSCAFAGVTAQEGRRVLTLMVHEQLPSGQYLIQNHFFDQNRLTGDLNPLPVPDGIVPQYITGTARFALLSPNIANNQDEGPMGLSIYANSIDILKAIDLAYDGAKTAMELGRPRMGVTANLLKVDASSGELREVFSPEDIAVYDMGGGGMDEHVEVKDLTVPYRADLFEQSLQCQLSLYAQSIGLGANTFKWTRAMGEVPRTATEVLAANDTMLRATEKHQDSIRGALQQVARAILDCLGRDWRQPVVIAFDASATRDREREALEAWEWVKVGMYPFWRYLVDFKGYDENEAREVAGGALPPAHATPL